MTERALALRRLAARHGGSATGPAAGGAAGLYGGLQGQLGLAVELLFGWVVAALVAAAIVGLSTAIAPLDGPSPLPIVVPDLNVEMSEDLDPRDPLVKCTVFMTHTHCVREAT
jgi:hypothetical protein